MNNVVWILMGKSAIEHATDVLAVYNNREAAYKTMALCEESYDNDMNMYEDFWVDMVNIESVVSEHYIPGDLS